MDSLKKLQSKVKRVRLNPTRKWNTVKEKSLIDFLMANQEFKKPTAQAFYKIFSVEMKVYVEWKLVRSKVRNMRTSYNKAKAWDGSTGASSMNGETIKVSLLIMCTYFYELDDIFGSRVVENTFIVESLDELTADNVECTEADIEEGSSFNSLGIETENIPTTSRKGIYSRTFLSDIKAIQSEMLSYRKEKAEKEFSLKEKEFTLKKREIELREKEIESKERLQVMDLEMRERLAMEELKLKYK